MIGYCGGGYRLWIPIENKVVRSRDVKFDERKFEFKERSDLKQINENNDWDDQQDNLLIKEEKNKEEINEKEDNKEEERSETEIGTIQQQQQQREEDTGLRLKTTTPSYLQDYELYSAFCMLTKTEEPTTYEEAMKIPVWKDAIKKELESHENLGTWSPSQLPKGKVAVDTKWVFRSKEDGSKKARLVVKGFQLQDDESSQFSYAPVCRMTTLRILISQAIRNDWKIRQVDVPTAFLNSTLKEEIYIKKPKGLNCSDEVFKLNRALYGLKISPKSWNDKFNEIMVINGFTRSQHDYCLYYSDDVYLLLFVDDALITGKTETVENLINILYKNFKVKDMGEANMFLGMQFNRTNDGLIINQNKIIDKLLKEFNMEKCRGVTTPMEVVFKLDESNLIIDVPYRQLVCSLMYIAVMTRPDLSFAVSILSRVLDKPTIQTWQAAKRVLRYLSATKEKGLRFDKNEGKLISYSDADWAGDTVSR